MLKLVDGLDFDVGDNGDFFEEVFGLAPDSLPTGAETNESSEHLNIIVALNFLGFLEVEVVFGEGVFDFFLKLGFGLGHFTYEVFVGILDVVLAVVVSQCQ